ncbi:MAG: HEAT repeat domain-containing protein [Phycisphaerae bacterium]
MLKPQAIAATFRLPGERRQRALIAKLARTPAQSLPVIMELAAAAQPPAVSRWAVEALGYFPEKVVLPTLLAALGSPHMSVRLHALGAIQQLHNPKLARHLKPLLGDPSGSIRLNTLILLVTMKPRWLKAAARKLMGDSKSYVRGLAVKVLGESR